MSLLYSHDRDLYSVQRLPVDPALADHCHLVLTVECQTVEYGQKLFIGLLEEGHHSFGPESHGLGVSIDPETGAVEDLVNGAGVIGYVESFPFEPGARVTLGFEIYVYGRTVIPRLRVGEEVLVHPALLIDPGIHLSALAGGDITNGNGLAFENACFVATPLAGAVLA